MELEAKAKLYEIIERVWTRLQRREYEAEYELFVDDDDNDKVGSDRLFPIPKGDADLWYQAMNVLQSYGVVYFSITDQDNNLVEINLDAGHKINDGWYCYVSNFKRPKFIEFCEKQGIDLTKPIKLTFSARLELTDDNVLCVNVNNSERFVYGRLIKGTGLNILRIATKKGGYRDKRLTIDNLKSFNQYKGLRDSILVSPLVIDKAKSFSEYFKHGQLASVASKVIDVHPGWVCVPQEKEIDVATYLSLQEQAKKVEKI